MPVAEAVITPSQAAETARAATGSAVSAGVPTWHAGQAMTPPSAACPSQQEQGSCAGFAAATTTAGKATHSTAATRASVDRIRVAKAITSQGYEGRRALSGLLRLRIDHDCVTIISNIPEIPFDIPAIASQIPAMKLDDAAARLEALGNPTRLKIYRTLVRAGQEGMPVGRLQARLDIAASTLSHHLKALVGVGLVTQTREGTTLVCHTNYDMMRGVIDFMVEECCAEGTCAPAALSKMPKVA
jgi:ArsR family transcriptional regulator